MKQILLKVIRLVDYTRLHRLSNVMINLISRQDYASNLIWFGTPIFQTPTDLFLYQQLIFRAKPNLIIETGVAKGGSILFSCQMLDLIHQKQRSWRVICCDINSMNDAKQTILRNGYQDNVVFFQGDSASIEFRGLVKDIKENTVSSQVLLSLDSNHTQQHVLNELISLGNFVSSGSYAIVWDSRISDLSWLTFFFRQRLWGKKNNPESGAAIYLNSSYNDGFQLDFSYEKILRFTGIKNGILHKL